MVDRIMEKRDRIRALVEQVLATVPVEGECAGKDIADRIPEHVVVNSLQEKVGKALTVTNLRKR